MPLWLEAGLWGLLSGGALVLGAAIGYTVRLSERVVAGVMAFGAGVLISALSFELVLEAYKQAGPMPAALGFGAGAVIYSVANWLVARLGAKHRKRSGTQQPSEDQAAGSGAGIALGALIDGIPESMAIGLTMLSGGAVSVATVAAIFVSNVPEGLSSSAGMMANDLSEPRMSVNHNRMKRIPRSSTVLKTYCCCLFMWSTSLREVMVRHHSAPE